MLGEVRERAVFLVQHGHRALAHRKGAGHGIPHAPGICAVRLQAVHYQLYEVRLVAVQRRNILQLKQFLVYPHLGVAAFPQLVEELPIVPLAPPHQRSQ